MKAALEDIVSRILGTTGLSLRPGPAGFNSTIYISDTDSGRYLVKVYKRRPRDHRNRLETEFRSLKYLWAQGLRQVPEPVGRNQSRAIGIYRHMTGVRPETKTIADFDQAVRFLRQLRSLSRKTSSERFSRASEACFSLSEYLDAVRRRYARLVRVADTRLQKFLRDGFLPYFRETADYAAGEYARAGLTRFTRLPRKARTLSPSDFGFHNALKDDRGRIIFLDFEYFGWDDPAKLISDFLLHPAMELAQVEQRYFFHKAYPLYKNADLRARLPSVYRICALKWCMIMLNAFLRKEDAGVQSRQLTKAKSMLSRIAAEVRTGNLPFSGEL
ncbi:hypothetical protein A2Z33_04080 [Candidatus Gottesmanbacteria bacterium RBG_16_52_11]|uniref:Aminoglycoside phosphotransferase domain-containing protein n=1 Tax=Candidatus Gottesmanbacteria bacterium RBG_16_52_11 TaxID=1798374 RepID=A0A1F5YVS4_9BACT|nr:MAG: hypothetical protein A2Z33_04080 [Candidatus Gottesmanbacteria bacterium RBG_16_52_11]